MSQAEIEKQINILYPKLIALARQRCDSNSDAEDAVQETIIKALKAADTFRKESQLYTWMVRILFNVCIDLHRKKSRTIEYPDDDQLFINLEANKFDQPEEKFEQKATFQRLKKAIMTLKPAHREVIVLKYFEGFSYEKIGGLLDVEVSLVKSRLYLARQTLRSLLQGEMDN